MVLRNAGLSGIELSGLILVVFSLVFSFYREKDSRILEVYLSNFSRMHYISGKLMGYLAICMFYLILAGLGYALILYLYNAFIWQVIVGLYTLFLKLSIVICLSLTLCCLFSNSPVITLLCSLFLYLSGEVAYSAFKIIARSANKLQVILFECLYRILPNLERLDIKSLVIYGELPAFSFFILSSLYGLGYFLFIWLIMQFIFLRKEY